MRITHIESQLLRLSLTRSIAMAGGDDTARLEQAFVLVVQLDTDAGHRGLGYAYSVQGGGRALKAIADDDLTPLLVGEDPLDHERLGLKVQRRLQSIGRRGLVLQAYSAIDLALWDLKGKVAGLPLYKLLGGVRTSAPVYAADNGWLWQSPDEIIAAARTALGQGMMGIKVKVGNRNPQVDAERLTQIRETLGDDIWLAVDANQRYDYATAVSIGHYFEEEIEVDWFEEPIACDDVHGHARLAERLEVPLAVGESLFGIEEFERYLEANAASVLQPDITRLGGLTPCLRVAALAERYHCPLAPHLMPEVAVHLACGRPNVMAVEYMPWFSPLFVEVPQIVQGQLTPLKHPGLGLELDPDAVEKFGVS